MPVLEQTHRIEERDLDWLFHAACRDCWGESFFWKASLARARRLRCGFQPGKWNKKHPRPAEAGYRRLPKSLENSPDSSAGDGSGFSGSLVVAASWKAFVNAMTSGYLFAGSFESAFIT